MVTSALIISSHCQKSTKQIIFDYEKILFDTLQQYKYTRVKKATGWASLNLCSAIGVPLQRLGPRECQQVRVDLILKHGCEAVRCTRIVDFLRALDESGCFYRRVLDGNYLVVLAVHDKGRDIDLLEVLGEIGL